MAVGTSVRAVIFDMDGVLCSYDLARRLEALERLSGRPSHRIERDIWGSGFEEMADSGCYPTGADYLVAFGERLGHPITRHEWMSARRQAMAPNRDVLELVARLRGTMAVALLSNNGPLTEECLIDLFPEAHRLFAGTAFFSWSFGVKKPDPAIYLAIARALRVMPGQAVFLDDKAHNVEGARAAGLIAFQFTTYGQLVADLAPLGIP